MYHFRKLAIASVWITTVVLLTAYLPAYLSPRTPEERLRDRKWVESSPYWLDRHACKWFSLCGIHHLRWDRPTRIRGAGNMQSQGRFLVCQMVAAVREKE